MGLGKTLEMIALIVTNFVGGKPLAVPIEGLMRQRKSLQDITQKAKVGSVFVSISISKDHVSNTIIFGQTGLGKQRRPRSEHS